MTRFTPLLSRCPWESIRFHFRCYPWDFSILDEKWKKKNTGYKGGAAILGVSSPQLCFTFSIWFPISHLLTFAWSILLGFGYRSMPRFLLRSFFYYFFPSYFHRALFLFQSPWEMLRVVNMQIGLSIVFSRWNKKNSLFSVNPDQKNSSRIRNWTTPD